MIYPFLSSYLLGKKLQFKLFFSKMPQNKGVILFMFFVISFGFWSGITLSILQCYKLAFVLNS